MNDKIIRKVENRGHVTKMSHDFFGTKNLVTKSKSECIKTINNYEIPKVLMIYQMVNVIIYLGFL